MNEHKRPIKPVLWRLCRALVFAVFIVTAAGAAIGNAAGGRFRLSTTLDSNRVQEQFSARYYRSDCATLSFEGLQLAIVYLCFPEPAMQQPQPYGLSGVLTWRVYPNFGWQLNVNTFLLLAPCLLILFAGLLRRIRRWRRVARGLCPTCAYSLKGNVSGRCPECGTPAKTPAKTI